MKLIDSSIYTWNDAILWDFQMVKQGTNFKWQKRRKLGMISIKENDKVDKSIQIEIQKRKNS